MFNVVFHLAHTWIVIIVLFFFSRTFTFNVMHAKTTPAHISAFSALFFSSFHASKPESTPISANSLVRFASKFLFFQCFSLFELLCFVWATKVSDSRIHIVCHSFSVFEYCVDLKEMPVSTTCSRLCIHNQHHNTSTLFHCTNSIQSLPFLFVSLSHFPFWITHSQAILALAWLRWYSLSGNLNIFYYCHTFPHIYLHW